MAECLMLPLSAASDREFSGHMDEALQFVASGAESDGYGVHRDADMLEESMKGMGTKDECLSASVLFGLAGTHSDTFNSLSHHLRPLESEGAVDEGKVGDMRDKVLGVEDEIAFVPWGDGLEGRKQRNCQPFLEALTGTASRASQGGIGMSVG